jgi:hypothetical protein
MKMRDLWYVLLVKNTNKGGKAVKLFFCSINAYDEEEFMMCFVGEEHQQRR